MLKENSSDATSLSIKRNNEISIRWSGGKNLRLRSLLLM
jgi:hypothetical protein